MPNSQPTQGIEVAFMPNETVINAASEQGLKALAKDLADVKSGDPVLIRARVFDNSFNRNGWYVDEGGLEETAASAVGGSVLLNHDANQVVGEILESAVNGDAVEQLLEIRTAEGKARLSAGGVPEFSVRMVRKEDTEVTCTLCGEAADDVESDCAHWRGISYGGEEAAHRYSSGKFVETSIVIGGATDTFPLAAQAADDDLYQLHQQRLVRISQTVAATNHNNREEVMSEVSETQTVEAPAETATEAFATLQTQLLASEAAREELRDELMRLQGERVADDVRAAIRSARVDGKLNGDEDEMVSVALNAPEAIKQFLQFIPRNKNLAAGVQVSAGAATDPGSGPPRGFAQLTEQCRREARDEAAVSGESYDVIYPRIWRERRAEMERANSAKHSRHEEAR